MPTSTPVHPDSRAAVTAALRLVAARFDTGHAPVPANTSAGVPTLPTHKARAAIDYIAAYATYEDLEATRPPLRALFVDAFGWNGDQRVTKPLNKTLVAAMSSTADSGLSAYAQTAEMVSYLALCAPLLEPDRLARIAELARSTPNAYKPIRYLVTPATQLRRLLSRFSDQRREDLLASLWVTAHDGRWWDATAGSEPTAVRRRRRRRAEEEMPQEQRDAIAEQLRHLMAADMGAPDAGRLIAAFDNRLITYSLSAARMIGRVRLEGESQHRELRRHAEHPDADVPVLLSYVPQLKPDERPESPIPQLISQLVSALGEGLDEDDALPGRPVEWADLFPVASREDFPMPNRMRQLSKVEPLPGAVVQMMTTAERLRRNADHMGNCTFGYKARSEAGTDFIGHLSVGAAEYNFAVTDQHHGWYQHRTNIPGQQWFLGEVNSRFNQGAVPADVIAALDAMIVALMEP